MLWINFLHLYQPANSENYHIKEATEKSYLRIIRALEEHPEIKFTLNINGCLILRWGELGYYEILNRLKRLAERGQLEITGTAAYHPLLPLTPKEEIVLQIKENEEILKKHFGENFKPKGFFMPEMAYGKEAAKIIKSLGYEWTMLDEFSSQEKIDFSKIYKDSASGLKIIFRSRKLSNSFVPESMIKLLNQDKTFITGTDGELYGLRHVDHSAKFEKLLAMPGLKTATISEYIKGQKTENVNLISSNWESTKKELKEKTPFFQWQDKKNPVHTNLWKLANLALEASKKFKNDKMRYWTRWHLVRGLASCTFWWASGKNFKESFGPIAWSPDEVERGTNDLVRSIRSIDDVKSTPYKLRAEKINGEIRKILWTAHWKKHWKK